jgi:ADP-ribosylation factor-like protein 2
LLIFANKQDLAGALTLEQISDFLDLTNEDISGRHWTIIACSAMTSEGLIEGFEWIVDDISSRIFQMS